MLTFKVNSKRKTIGSFFSGHCRMAFDTAHNSDEDKATSSTIICTWPSKQPHELYAGNCVGHVALWN